MSCFDCHNGNQCVLDVSCIFGVGFGLVVTITNGNQFVLDVPCHQDVGLCLVLTVTMVINVFWMFLYSWCRILSCFDYHSGNQCVLDVCCIHGVGFGLVLTDTNGNQCVLDVP